MLIATMKLSSLPFFLFLAVVGSSVVEAQGQNDCSQLETGVINNVIELGIDSKNKLFDTIERLQSRLNGSKQCTDSEWRINYGHLSYYKIGDGTSDGVGCEDLPFTGMDWPYDTNDKGVDEMNYPKATVREGMCGSGLVLNCTPEPIKAKYSYDRPTNNCPRVYCITDADPLVAGEYWEDISNFVQDQVPRYIKGEIDYKKYEECRIPPPAATRVPTTSPIPEEGEQTCEGGREDVLTKLDFFEATLIDNTLHNPDGRLRYEGVGIFKGDAIDLVVTQNPDSPPYSTDMSIRNGYNRGDDPKNPDTRWERFGNINVMTKDPRDDSTSDEDKALMNGEATFDFCFYYTGTENKATIDSFDWSVYDLDWRNSGGLNEKFTIDTSQTQHYRVQGDTEVKMWCENEGPASAIKSGTFSYEDHEGKTRTVDRYKPVTCDPGVKTIFHSSSKGALEDNPTDPEKLTKQQLSRSVEFRFVNTNCWTFKYEHYCPCDNYCKEDGGGPSNLCSKNKWCPQSKSDHKNFDDNYPNACKSYTGGNFLFAGTADAKITEEGECVTPPPPPPALDTESPTISPTAEPTADSAVAPTNLPTAEPTNGPSSTPTTSPSKSPTKDPTAVPSASPSLIPTGEPSLNLSSSPSATPSSDPSASSSTGPSVSPSTFPSSDPSGSPSSKPSAPPSSKPSVSPSNSPSASPSTLPSSNPSGSPSGKPSDSPTGEPTNSPSSSPSSSPSDKPSASPSESPSSEPSVSSSDAPSGSLSEAPSGSFFPSSAPSDSPTVSKAPSSSPSSSPSKSPTGGPTSSPSSSPSASPSAGPSASPSTLPSSDPSASPSKYPSASPSSNPTRRPTGGPTNKPSDSPSGGPSFDPSSTPSTSPSSTPSASPTEVPTSAPTEPPTATPTTAPTISSTAAPSKAPTTAAPTVSPTKEPTESPSGAPTTLSPTLSPTVKAVTRPPINTNGEDDDDDTFFQPTCPEDISLVAHKGQKEIDLDRVVKIISQDISTVKVSLNQGWDQLGDEDIPIDHIYYTFRPDNFDEKCYEETSVMIGTVFDTITITCSVTKPFALLEICVVDDLKNELLSIEDNATIPKCCHPTETPETPTVCYTIEIKCVTECVEDDNNNVDIARKLLGLRGSY